MKFKPANLRKLDESHNKYPLGIRVLTASPLILCKSTGEVEFAANRGDKDRLVASFNEKKDLLIWAWRGEYNTDMFQLSAADIERHYK